MKAARFHKTGGPEVVVYEDVPDPTPELIQSTLGEILGFIMGGRLPLQVGTVLPLSQAAEAHRLLKGRKTPGKDVLRPRVDGR